VNVLQHQLSARRAEFGDGSCKTRLI